MQDSVKISKTQPYAKHFIHSLCVFSVVHGSKTLYDILESITKGLIGMIVLNVWPFNKTNIATSKDDIKHILVGGTKLLVESPITDNPDLWIGLLKSLVASFAANKDLKLESVMDEENAEGKDFDSTYSKLTFGGISYTDPTNEIASGVSYFVVSLSKFTQSNPGKYAKLIQEKFDESEKEALQKALQQNSVGIV